MSLQKGVASQKIVFVMVDKTDFATPEPGITVQGGISKDGAAKASMTNSVSEIYSGLYVLTLQNSEVDCDVMAVRLHDGGTACATQHLVFYPEDGYAVGVSDILEKISELHESVISDISAMQDDVTSVLADTKSIIVDISLLTSGFDSFVYGPMGSIMGDWSQLVSDVSNIESALINSNFGLDVLETMISLVTQDVSIVSGAVSDLHASVITATDLVQSHLDNADYGLDALETITSDILELGGGSNDWTEAERKQMRSALGVTGDVSALAAYGTNSRLDNANYGLDALETYVSQIESNVSNISGVVSNILVDTAEISNIAGASDSAAISALHESIIEDISLVLSSLDSGLDGVVASILVDTKTTLPATLATISNAISDVESNVSNISNVVSAILVDTAEISNIAGASDSAAISALHESIIEDVSLVLSSLDSGLDGVIASILVDTKTTLPAAISAVLSTTDSQTGDLASILADTKTALPKAISDLESTLDSGLDGVVASILVDTKTTLPKTLSDLESTLDSGLDGVITSILADTSALPAAVWAETGGVTGETFDLLVDRIYQMLSNKMHVDDATGVMELMNVADDDSIATGGVTDDDTDTYRLPLTWVP